MSPDRRTFPKRTSAHVLSAQSTKALQDALPAEWTVEPRQHDYGVDFEVEIFEDGTTTGLLFSVQLKSTQAVGKTPSTRIKRATANYWSSLDRPVLVIMYEAPTGHLLWQWWHRYDPYGTDTTTGTFSLKFPPANIWDPTTTAAEIAREVRAWRAWTSAARHLPISVIIDRRSELDPGVYGRVVASLRRRLIAVDGLFELRTTPASDLVLSVEIGSGESVIWLSGGPSATLHHGELHLTSDASVEQFSADLALLVASRLSLLRLDRHAAVLAALVAVESSAIWHGDFLHATTWLILDGGLLAEAIDLVAFIVSSAPRDLSNAATIALMSWARAGDWLRRLQVTAALADWSGGQEGDRQRAAEFSYNASQLVRRDDRQAALRLLDRAGDLDESYRDRGYWWAERAGLLFLDGRYDDAVEAYEEAVALGEREARPLLADALMWARRFEDSARLFNEVNADPGLSTGEWRLKSFVLTAFGGRLHEVNLLDPNALHEAAEDADQSADDRVALSIAAALADAGSPELWMAAMEATLREELFLDVAITARRFCGQEIVTSAYEIGVDPAFALALQRLFEELPPEPPERNVLRYYDTEGGLTIIDLNEPPADP